LNFGHELAKEINANFPRNPAAIVDVYTPMDHVCRNLSSYGLTQEKQPTGIEVRYGQLAALHNDQRQIWADAIKQHFELAALRQNQDAHFVVKGSQ
jgi:hypothetical protein